MRSGNSARQVAHQKLGGLEGAGKAAREAQVEDVASLLQKAAHERLGLGQVRQRRGDDLALAHHGVELLEVGVLRP